MEELYELGYYLLTVSYTIPRNMKYNETQRIIILITSYPLLVMTCYKLAIAIYTQKLSIDTVYITGLLILLALVINYFQQAEILFDIDDIKRYILTGIAIFQFMWKAVTIVYTWNLKKYFL